MFTSSHRNAATPDVRNESGFTVIEMLMAIVILLIAFSGIMSLMMANTYMNVRAKEKATLVNEANSYIERVRQMNYDDIGALAAYTVTTNGFVITVTPTVTPMTDPGIVNSSGVPLTGVLKKLTVMIAGHRVGTEGPILSYQAETVIKKTDSGINEGALLPTIYPTPSSPASDAVVYGNAVNIGAIAAATGEGVVLTDMTLMVNRRAARNQYGEEAKWALNSASYTSPTFLWDTTAKDEDGYYFSSGNKTSPDGLTFLSLEVQDSNGERSTYEWSVVVDNEPPTWPLDGWITATSLTSTSMKLDWSAVTEGNMPVHHYNIDIQKWVSGAWSTPVTTSFSAASGIAVSTPFSKYQYTVNAVGPPLQDRESASNSQVIAISRPEILSTSTWRNYTPDSKNIATLVTIKLSPPTFPVPMGTKSTLYKSSSASMSASSTVGVAFTGWSPPEFTVDVVNGNGWPSANQYYYQVVTTFPTGAKFSSQIVGPNGTSGAEATPFVTVGW